MRQCMTAADGPRPPLAESGDLRIVSGHRQIDFDDRIAGKPEPDAEIGLFAGDCLLVEPADLTQRRYARGHDAAETVHVLDPASRAAPFDRAQAIVDRRFRVPFG